jgi:small-conductance mechanosensitive channel
MRRLLWICIFISAVTDIVEGQGRLLSPPGRSSLWRFGFGTPVNYNDNALSCGGVQVKIFSIFIFPIFYLLIAIFNLFAAQFFVFFLCFLSVFFSSYLFNVLLRVFSSKMASLKNVSFLFGFFHQDVLRARNLIFPKSLDRY